MIHAKDYYKRRQQVRRKRGQHTKPHHLERARAHLQRREARAQCHLYPLDQMMEELGVPKTVVEEIQWKRQA
jgi:hypothetical protein